MAGFILPKTTYHGLGSIDNLRDLQGKKAVIVTGGSSMRKFGYIDKCIALLKEAKIKTAVFEGVEENPSIETVKKGAEFFLKEKPDIIIGLGGGSAIDAAKLMWVFYEHPKTTLEEIIPPHTIKPLRKKAIFVAVPSTSGTGTEVTCVSVVTDRKKGVKYPIVSYEITPDIAIVDGELCRSMPKHVTVHTGLDALAHDTETFVSTLSNSYTDSMAFQSVRMVFENLPKAFHDADNLEVRQAMHDAATLAGMAFTNAFLGIVHAMAHQLGGMFGVPHGCANAILLPNVIRFNSRDTNKYTLLAQALGKSTAEDYASEVERLRSEVGVESSLKEWGIEEKLWKEKLEEMAENAMKDACVGANPRVPSVEDIITLFDHCYYGKKWKEEKKDFRATA